MFVPSWQRIITETNEFVNLICYTMVSIYMATKKLPQQNKTSKKWHWISLVIVVVFAIGFFVFNLMRSYADYIRTEQLGVTSGFFTEVKNIKTDGPVATGPQLQVENGSHASLGPIDAKVTVVEFGDFQCPYCQRSFPVLRFVMGKYQDQVKFVYRHFPVATIHPKAAQAAAASECARDQGKFWEYHDILYQNPNTLEIEDLKKYAQVLELDTVQFAQCLDGGEKQEKVRKDVEDGLQAGVTGTPTFYVNGFRIQGYLSVEAWEEIFERIL